MTGSLLPSLRANFVTHASHSLANAARLDEYDPRLVKPVVPNSQTWTSVTPGSGESNADNVRCYGFTEALLNRALSSNKGVRDSVVYTFSTT